MSFIYTYSSGLPHWHWDKPSTNEQLASCGYDINHNAWYMLYDAYLPNGNRTLLKTIKSCFNLIALELVPSCSEPYDIKYRKVSNIKRTLVGNKLLITQI